MTGRHGYWVGERLQPEESARGRYVVAIRRFGDPSSSPVFRFTPKDRDYAFRVCRRLNDPAIAAAVLARAL